MKKCIKMEIEDKSLFDSLAPALASRLSAQVFEEGAEEGITLSDRESPECGIFLSDDFSWLPLSKLTALIEAAEGEGGGAAPRAFTAPAACVFTGLSAGAGGCGLSSSAAALGRIYSRLYGLRCLYLNFSYIGRDFPKAPCSPALDAAALAVKILTGRATEADVKAALLEDEYGMYFTSSSSVLNPFYITDGKELCTLLSCLAELGHFERMILDIPADFPACTYVMKMCENKIVLFGYDKKTHPLSDKLISILGAETHTLVQEFDEFSFQNGEVDIHGQFGSAVRELAGQLEI